MFCSYCGAKINDDAKFCSACGKPVAGEPETVEPEQAETAVKEKKVKEKKPKEKVGGKAVLDKKLFGKLPLKFLLGGVAAVVVVVLAIVLISNAVEEKKRTTILGTIPDPETFVGVSGEHDHYDSWYEHDISFKKEDVTEDMAQAYVELLCSNEYPFVLNDTIEFNDGMVRYLFVYNGEEELYDASPRQIMVEYKPYAKTYALKVEISNYKNFELVPVGQYGTEDAGQSEGGLVVIAAPDHYFGTDAKLDDDTMRFTVEDSPADAAHDYVALLQSKYGMELQDSYEDEDCGEWVLCAEGNGEATFCISIDRAGDGTWEVLCNFSVYVFPADAEVWGGTEGPRPEQPIQSEQPTQPAKPAQPEVVAGEISVSNAIEVPGNAVPELGAWSGGAARADRLVTRSESTVEYDVSTPVVKEYVQALQANGFTLVDEYYFSYKGKTFQSWGLTCNALPDAQTIKMQYEDTPCHVTIWMADDDDEYTVSISSSLQFYDTGLRRGNTVVNETIAGPSAGAGLLRLGDGSYQTTDGRLTAAVGNAMVIRDGKTYTCDARWEVEKEDERLWVEDYYRNEGFLFEVPKSSLMEGDVLLASDLMRERYHTTEKDSLDSFNWHTPLFALAYNGMWKGPELNGTDYEALTVRVMYYQKGGDAVYYVYAKLNYTEPSEVEALVAVNMGSSSGGNFDNATRLKVGDTVTLNYSHQEYGSHYDVYEWAVTDGAGNVSIDGVGDHCTVTARSKGVATVTVTYKYGVTEPDVLTGIPRRTSKSKTQSYNFIIE